jgi:hypothetical protein
MEDISSSGRSQIYDTVFLPRLQVSRIERKEEFSSQCMEPRTGEASQHEIIFMTLCDTAFKEIWHLSAAETSHVALCVYLFFYIFMYAKSPEPS